MGPDSTYVVKVQGFGEVGNTISNVTEPTSATLFLYNTDLETLQEIEVDADASKISVENLKPLSEYTTYLVITNKYGTYTSDEYSFFTPDQSVIHPPEAPLNFLEIS